MKSCPLAKRPTQLCPCIQREVEQILSGLILSNLILAAVMMRTPARGFCLP